MKLMNVLAVVVLTAGALLGGACSGPTEPKPGPFEYPLEVGNQWEYVQTQVYDFRDERPDSIEQWEFAVEVVRVDTIVDDILQYHMHGVWMKDTIGGGIYEGTNGYLNTADGLYLRMSDASLLVLPKTPSTRSVAPRGFGAMPHVPLAGNPDQSASFPIVYEPALLVLPYPQSVGARWVFNEFDEPEGAFERMIDGREKIATEAGSFDCFRIRFIFPPELADISVTDYVAEEGLVRRVIEIPGFITTDYLAPTGRDTVAYSETYNLVGYTLK